LLCLVLGLAGCGGSGSSDQAKIRVVNASPNQGSLDILIDKKAVFSALGFPNSTAYMSVSPASHELQLEPTGSTNVVIDQTVNATASTNYTFLVDNFAANLSGMLLTDDNTTPTSGNFNLRLINAAPSLGPVDIYVVTPGTDVSTVSPTVSNLSFEAASSYQSLVAGTYEVFFTAPGTKFAFIDSGPISFTAGQIRTMLALDGQSGGGFTFTTLADVN